MLPAFPRDAPLKFKTKSNVKSSSSYFATLVQNVKMLMQSVYSYHFKCALEKINPLTQTLSLSLFHNLPLSFYYSLSLSLFPPPYFSQTFIFIAQSKSVRLPQSLASLSLLLVSSPSPCFSLYLFYISHSCASVTRLGDLLDFVQLFKAFGKN